MPRTARKAPADMIFHVLNRAVGKQRLFHKDEDFAAFERALAFSLEQHPLDMLAYCLMPNHWHLLLRPHDDRQLGQFMQRLTLTHTRRWKEHYHEVGFGHLYQGRYKSFPVQDDRHFLVVARYVERNALRANIVKRAEQWRWSSLWRRQHGGKQPRDRVDFPLASWPVRRPVDYVNWVNEPQTMAEVEAVRKSIAKGRPFGDIDWQAETTRELGLESSYRERGRPKKEKSG